MSKAVSLNWSDFMEGNVTTKKQEKVNKAMGSGFAFYAIMVPMKVLAATGAKDSSFEKVLKVVFDISDYLCIGVIIFTGVVWMFGTRSAAIERLLSGSIGYVIIRHARDIQRWLGDL